MKASEESINDAEYAQQVSQNLVPNQMGPGEREFVSACSALMDGLISEQDWDALWESPRLQASTHEEWNAYQIVGDALRGGVPLVAVTPPADFLAGFQSRLQQEFPAALHKTVNETPATSTSPPMDGRRATAANDAIFRWKMLAMAASVSAVMAVSWGVLGAIGDVGDPQTGAEMAQAAPAEVVVAEPSGGLNSSIIVNTGQGPLIRDARLEALLAEHRQYGGMSALQKPAGFLRNATYDAPDR